MTQFVNGVFATLFVLFLSYTFYRFAKLAVESIINAAVTEAERRADKRIDELNSKHWRTQDKINVLEAKFNELELKIDEPTE